MKHEVGKWCTKCNKMHLSQEKGSTYKAHKRYLISLSEHSKRYDEEHKESLKPIYAKAGGGDVNSAGRKKGQRSLRITPRRPKLPR